MNPEKLHDALNYLDDDLITQTDALRQGKQVPRRHPGARRIIAWAAAAACLVLVMGAAPALMPAMESDNASNGSCGMLQDAVFPPQNQENVVVYEGAQASIQESKTDDILKDISCGAIHMEIPQTWEHEIVKEDGGGYFLVIRPPHEEGSVRVGYWPGFGVCGTGLATEEAVIAGRNACVGTYDGNPVWRFITLGDDYVVLNDGADAWWGLHGDLLMKCLETLVIGEAG